MRNLKGFSAILTAVAFSIGSAAACEDDHSIESVSSDGRIVTLKDGSVWEVDTVDRVDSKLWLPASEIVACDDTLINMEDGDFVKAVRIR